MKSLLFLITILFVLSYTTYNHQQGDPKTNYDTEEYRPQFHFTPEEKWMNDPNGLVYYDGEYHLFYQYYPDSTVWGPMHWGHAVSTDLVHWQHLPIALYPDNLGYIFSGSAVVDRQNTTGFGTNTNPPMVAIFTYHNPTIRDAGGIEVETQGIAYSLDKGRTWAKYKDNPVIKNPNIRDFRDPNVFWNESIGKWNLVLAAHDHVQIYSSPNLKEWQHESDFGFDIGAHGGVWECPNLFRLKVPGTDMNKWVLLVSINPGGINGGSATQYFVGDFDGANFTTKQSRTQWLDYGRDNYAGVTWNNIPQKDGRRLFLGWMSNWDYAQVVPTEKWRSAMTIPRELKLQKKDRNYLVTSTPVKEMEKLRGKKLEIVPQLVSGMVELQTPGIIVSRSELNFQFNLQNKSQSGLPEEFGIALSNNEGETIKIGYSPGDKKIFTDRTKAGDNTFSDNFAGRNTADYLINDNLELRVFIDKASIEVFVNKGEIVMTDIVFPTTPYNKIEVYSKKGTVKLDTAEIWNLSSIW